MPSLDRIQSVIANRPPEACAAMLVFRIGPVDGARAFLRAVLAKTPSAASNAPRGAVVLHPSLSWRGIARLAQGLPNLDPDDGARALEPFFVDPLPSHPEALGFVGASAPDRWWDGAWSSAEADIVLHALAPDDAGLVQAVADLRAEARRAGLVELRVPSFPDGAMAGKRPPGGVLHFGYRDGLTSPDVDWLGNGSGTVDFREILLGYPDDAPVSTYPANPATDGPWREFVRDGSIGCVTWIEQHVHAFAAHLAEAATNLGGAAPANLGEEWLAARLMGRWRDGSPTLRWPDAPPAAPDHDDAFDFRQDPRGERCPLGAHIRLVNPRIGGLKAALQAKFPKGPPKLIRRGFSYGPPMTAEEDGIGRGLVGVFYGARLNEQHLSVLRWMQEATINDRFGQPPYTRKMQDGICGIRAKPGADTRHAIPNADGSAVTVALRDFITFRGVLHVLTPSLPTLARLAAA